MHQTDSVQLIDKLSIVNPFYFSLQEEDLEEFTHEHLRELAGVLSSLNSNRLEGENKKINDILTQRSLAHIKKFTNKYKAFKFNVNMLENGYHRKLIEGRLNKPEEVAHQDNQEPGKLGVENIQPYQDIVVENQSEKTNVEKNGQETAENEVGKQKENRKNKNWNQLTSDSEDYSVISDQQSEIQENIQKEKQIIQKHQDSDSQISFDLKNEQQKPQEITPIQNYSHYNNLRLMTQQEAETTFEPKILINDPTSGSVKTFAIIQPKLSNNGFVSPISSDHQGTLAQIDFLNGLKHDHFDNAPTDLNFKHQEPQIIPKQDSKVDEDSNESHSFSIESQIDEDVLRQWVKKDTTNPTPDQQFRQENCEKENSDSENDQSDEDESEDFQDIKDKKVNEEKRKQIHPTVKQYHQYYLKNLENNKKQIENNNLKQASEQSKPIINNAIDYSKDRQWR